MIDQTLLNPEDVEAIKRAINYCHENGTTNIWDQEDLAHVKQKIKAHYRGLLGEICCYCCKNTHGEFNLVLDIEHILPKVHYLQFALSPFNLSVACKRCNMKVKGQDITFLNDPAVANEAPEDSVNYKFIHPNLDEYFDHLGYDSIIKNNKKLIKYTVVNSSPKGKYTYDYFKLRELEIDTLNAAQGIEIEQQKFSDALPLETISEIELLLNDLKTIKRT